MQFIDAPDCDSGDVDHVAKAVQTLIDLPAPSATLGHVGGDIGGESLVHSFLDWIPVADYKSVQDLNDHINNVSSCFSAFHRTLIAHGHHRSSGTCRTRGMST